MDEPTSALTDHETRRLFGIIREPQGPGARGHLHLAPAGGGRQIGDRVTVMRDGRRIGTLDVAQADVPRLVGMMVGRDLALTSSARGGAVRAPRLLRVEGLSRGGALRDIGLRLHEGEILALAGLVGAGRTEVARAVFGVDRLDSRRDLGLRDGGHGPASRRRDPARDRVRHRRPPGQRPHDDDVGARERHPAFAAPVRRAGRPVPQPAARAARGPATRPRPEGPAAVARAEGPLPERRQPAEGRPGQVADGPLPHPDPRRADAGNRCRRQGGRAPAHGRVHAPRRGAILLDLVGPAGGAADERPDRGDARGPDRRGAVAGGGDGAAGDAARGGRIGRRARTGSARSGAVAT